MENQKDMKQILKDAIEEKIGETFQECIVIGLSLFAIWLIGQGLIKLFFWMLK